MDKSASSGTFANATFVVAVKSPSAITVPKDIRATLHPYIGKRGRLILSTTGLPEDQSAVSYDVVVGHYASQLYPDTGCGPDMYKSLVGMLGQKVHATITVGG